MLQTVLLPAPRRDSRWLMVVLHGLGDSMEGYRWLPELLRVPELNYLLVNAPDAYHGGYSWYDYPGDPEPGVTRSRRMLIQLLDDQRGRGFPGERTFLFGFSQGCLMTMEIGARYDHLLAGLIGISGYVHQPERLVKELSPVAFRQRFLLTHGTHDSLIPIYPVKQQIGLLKFAGLNIDWREFEKDHTIAGEEEIAVFRQFIRERMSGHGPTPENRD